MVRWLARAVPCALLVVLSAACGNDPIETPTTPTPDPITETFSGTLTINDAATHTFSTSTAGQVTATLTGVSPEGAIMGMLLGIWNGAACSTVTANDTATQNTVIINTATTAAQLCVRVYDVGRFTEPTDYSVTVVHP